MQQEEREDRESRYREGDGVVSSRLKSVAALAW